MAITSFSNNAEGGSNGTALTVGDTTGGDAFTLVNHPGSGAITYSSDHAAHGSLSYKLASTASNACQVGVSGWTSDYIASRWYLYIASVPGAFELYRLYSSSTKMMKVGLDASGKLQVANAADTWVWTAAAVLPLNTWVRIEVVGIKGTTTSNGGIKIAYYSADSETATDSYTSSTANVGTAQFTQPWIGDTGGSGFITVQYVDDIAMAAQNTFIGPVDTGPAPADTVAPGSVTSNDGGWAANTGTIVDAVADGTDHDEYISVAEGTIVLRLDPMTDAPGTITVTADAGSDTQTLEVELLQGATVIASHTFDVTETIDDYTLSTTSTERGNVTDPTTLDVQLTAG